MEKLHDNFVMSVQTMQSRYKVFDVIGEWIEHLRNATDLEQSYNVELSESLHNEASAGCWQLLLLYITVIKY